VFGKDAEVLDRDWRVFFGWTSGGTGD